MVAHPLFADLAVRWLELLRRAACRVRANEAEDLASEAFCYYLDRWKHGPTQALLAFLNAVCQTARGGRLHPRCLWVLRRLSGRRSARPLDIRGDRFWEAAESAPTDEAARLDREEFVRRLLETAPPEERLLVERLRREMSMIEIARDMHRPLRTLYHRRQCLAERARRLRLSLGHPDP